MRGVLEVKDLEVCYGNMQVIFGVSFRVEKGELVALLGSNGSGKSTILNTISGIIKPKSGIISFNGYRIERMPAHKVVKLGIVQMPEGGKVFPYMTVEENLLVGAYRSKEAWEKRFETMERVFNLFPRLRELRKSMARSLSGGEQRMLAIGRALMALPKLLLVDEPSLGLAPKVVSMVYDVISRLREEKVTILLAEQNAHVALTIADRGYVLENGRIVLEGPSETLLNDPYMKKAYLGV